MFMIVELHYYRYEWVMTGWDYRDTDTKKFADNTGKPGGVEGSHRPGAADERAPWPPHSTLAFIQRLIQNWNNPLLDSRAQNVWALGTRYSFHLRGHS